MSVLAAEIASIVRIGQELERHPLARQEEILAYIYDAIRVAQASPEASPAAAEPVAERVDPPPARPIAPAKKSKRGKKRRPPPGFRTAPRGAIGALHQPPRNIRPDTPASLETAAFLRDRGPQPLHEVAMRFGVTPNGARFRLHKAEQGGLVRKVGENWEAVPQNGAAE